MQYLLLRLDFPNDDFQGNLNDVTAMNRVSIEHIMPQKPRSNADWSRLMPTPSLRSSILHKFGNLTMVSKTLNSSLSNRDWTEKRERYATAGNPSLTSNLSGIEDFNSAVLFDRHSEIIGRAEKFLWKEFQTGLPAIGPNGFVDEPKQDVEGNDVDDNDDDADDDAGGTAVAVANAAAGAADTTGTADAGGAAAAGGRPRRVNEYSHEELINEFQTGAGEGWVRVKLIQLVKYENARRISMGLERIPQTRMVAVLPDGSTDVANPDGAGRAAADSRRVNRQQNYQSFELRDFLARHFEQYGFPETYSRRRNPGPVAAPTSRVPASSRATAEEALSSDQDDGIVQSLLVATSDPLPIIHEDGSVHYQGSNDLTGFKRAREGNGDV